MKERRVAEIMREILKKKKRNWLRDVILIGKEKFRWERLTERLGETFSGGGRLDNIWDVFKMYQDWNYIYQNQNK